MTKYLILYNSDTSATEQMDVSQEQMQASMDEWNKWRDEATKTVKFDYGLPVKPITRITSRGEATNDSTVTGYSTMEGDKSTVMSLLMDHPHLKTPGATLDVMEMIPLDMTKTL